MTDTVQHNWELMHECTADRLSLIASLRVWKRPSDVMESPLQDAVNGALLRYKQQSLINRCTKDRQSPDDITWLTCTAWCQWQRWYHTATIFTRLFLQLSSYIITLHHFRSTSLLLLQVMSLVLGNILIFQVILSALSHFKYFFYLEYSNTNFGKLKDEVNCSNQSDP